MKQSQLFAIMTVAAATANFATLLPAGAENQSSEMRELVRQSQGLTPSSGESDSKAKKPQLSGANDPAAIYIQAGADTEQAGKIRELRLGFEKLQLSKGSEIVALYKELHELTTQADLDEAKIIATQEKINTLQATMAMEKTKTLLSVRKILTPKQRENLVAILKKRAATQSATPSH